MGDLGTSESHTECYLIDGHGFESKVSGFPGERNALEDDWIFCMKEGTGMRPHGGPAAAPEAMVEPSIRREGKHYVARSAND